MILENSNIPPDYWAYPSMKERVEAEGTPLDEYFCFHYQNAEGERTIRTFRSTHVLFSNFDLYIVGHCELRNEKRVFRASRITQAYLLGGDARLLDFSIWLRENLNQAILSKQNRFVRETGTGYIAIQTSKGVVHISKTIYSEIFDIASTLSELETTATLLARLPALAPDLAAEISKKSVIKKPVFE